MIGSFLLVFNGWLDGGLLVGTNFTSGNCGSGSKAKTIYRQARPRKQKSKLVLRYFRRKRISLISLAVLI